jgi:rhamnulokinase
MPEAIRDFCRKTGQSEPVTRGEIARCIYDSLALKYKYTLLQIEEVSGKKIDRLHIIGGGASNEMLNQLTADITGKQVISGPAEATAIGNIMMQAKALGITGSLSVIREIVRNSFEVKIYNPSPVLNMNKAYERFLKLV